MRKLSAPLATALAGGAAFLPMFASAQTLLNTLALVSTFLNSLVYLFITVAIVVFFWGLIQYLLSGGEDKAKGLNIMLMGVVTIFVMVSIWGLIRLLQSTFRVTSTEPVIPKTIQLDTRFVQ
jgi:hypothetical protein